MKVVLDTNVFVSGLLTPFGSSGEIVRMVFSGELELHIDARILSEYREVLQRKKFDFNKDHINVLLDFIEHYGHFVASSPLEDHLPDPDDEPFLEVAIAGEVKPLITGNAAHFPPQFRKGVDIFAPSEFIEYYRKQKKKKSDD